MSTPLLMALLAAGIFSLVLMIKNGTLPACVVAGIVVSVVNLVLLNRLTHQHPLMIAAYLFVWAASIAAAIAFNRAMRRRKTSKPRTTRTTTRRTA